MNDMKKYLDQAQGYATKFVNVIVHYRIILTFAVACLAIVAAVFQAQEFLNPSRDETTYTETKSQVNVKNIDEDVVNKLRETQEDADQIVDTDFVPGRDNPFAE